MRPPKERLTKLLELAAQGAGARPTLARELSDVLLDWPSDYSESAKLPFETLLEKTLRDVDRETRAAIAGRFLQRTDASVDLLNELFFSATVEMKEAIIARNAGPGRKEHAAPEFDEATLLALARRDSQRLQDALATALGVLPETAEEILSDVSGQSLAVACKGAKAGRATFSAVAVLCDKTRAAEDSYLRLASFDGIPQGAAERILASWRVHAAAASLSEAAAE